MSFFFFIYEIFFIFSLFFLIIVGIFLSNIKYLKNYYANFYNFYYIILFLLIIYGFLLYVFNIINYDYSLFLLTYSIDPLIYVGKVIFFMLVILFLIAFRFYIKLIKVYNFEIFFLLACSILGLFLLLSSSDFINMYLCIELYSLSMYSFMAHFKRRLINIEAAFKYFIVGSISSSFILFSISGIYAILGSFNFYDIELLLYYNSVAPYNYISNVLIHFFSYLIIISFFIKIGAAPLHL